MKKCYCLEGDLANNPLMDLLASVLSCELLVSWHFGSCFETHRSLWTLYVEQESRQYQTVLVPFFRLVFASLVAAVLLQSLIVDVRGILRTQVDPSWKYGRKQNMGEKLVMHYEVH